MTAPEQASGDAYTFNAFASKVGAVGNDSSAFGRVRRDRFVMVLLGGKE